MANVKISGLPAASAVADANEFEINEAGTSKKVTGSQIATYVGDEIGALTSSDLGTTVQPYDVDTAKYDATTANFTGTLQNGGSNVVVDSDIGSTVQAYDANTAKYNAATANFTGTLQNGGSNVVVDSDIGSTVQAYDVDTAKYDATTANFTGILQQNGTNVLLDSDINSTVLSYVAPGTSGNVLTSNGSAWTSTAPAGGGGAWDVLNVTDITSSTNTIIWDFSTWSSYETFRLIIAQAKPSSDNGALILEWGDDGASFSSNRDGNESKVYANFSTSSVADAHVICPNVGTGAGEEGVHGELTFMGFNQSGLRGYVFGVLSMYNASIGTYYIAQTTLTDAENSIRLSMGSAANETLYNFVDGTFTLLGLKTS